MTGAAHPAEAPRRARIKKGMFMTSMPAPEGFMFKRDPLPADLREFEEAARVADQIEQIERQHASNVRALTERMQKVREQIDVIKAKSK